LFSGSDYSITNQVLIQFSLLYTAYDQTRKLRIINFRFPLVANPGRLKVIVLVVSIENMNPDFLSTFWIKSKLMCLGNSNHKLYPEEIKTLLRIICRVYTETHYPGNRRELHLPNRLSTLPCSMLSFERSYVYLIIYV